MIEKMEEYQDKLIDLDVAILVAKKYNVVPPIEDIETDLIPKTYSMIAEMCITYDGWELCCLVNEYNDIKNKLRIELLCLILVIGFKEGNRPITCDDVLDYENRYDIKDTTKIFESYNDCDMSVEELIGLYEEKAFCYMEYKIV